MPVTAPTRSGYQTGTSLNTAPMPSPSASAMTRQQNVSGTIDS